MMRGYKSYLVFALVLFMGLFLLPVTGGAYASGDGVYAEVGGVAGSQAGDVSVVGEVSDVGDMPGIVGVSVASVAATAEGAGVFGDEAAIGEVLASLADSYINTADDWAAVAMAAYGRGDDVAGAAVMRNAAAAYISGVTGELVRSIIALTALGVDCTGVSTGSEGVYLDLVGKLSANNLSQTMEGIFVLLALDSGDYSGEAADQMRRQCIDLLLDRELTPAPGQSAWAAFGSTPDVDVTAMAVTALAAYRDESPEVARAVRGALNYLAGRQTEAGHFGNSNATSMVVIALAALGLDPGDSTVALAKSGHSVVDGLLSFVTADKRFGYDDNVTANLLSTEQGFRGLAAYWGYLNSGDGYFNIYRFGPQTGDGSLLSGEADPQDQPTDPDLPVKMTVRVEDIYRGVTLMPPTVVELQGTHLDALKRAIEANGENPATSLTEGGGFVSSLLGVSGGPSTAWMYAINGRIPDTSLSETKAAQGDSLVMFFADWSDAYYLAVFDQPGVSVKTGEVFTLTLKGANPWDVNGGSVKAPIAQATLVVWDQFGQTSDTGVVTDENGRGSLAFSKAGIYTVSAVRPGAINANDLIGPICLVTVTNPTSSSPESPENMTVYFTLQGLNSSGNEEIWINSKGISNIVPGATVADVVIRALEGTGYTQSGANSGIIRAVTTPGGLNLSEGYSGWPNSGWLYRVNGQLPLVGVTQYKVQNGDQVLLYFTKDFTKDPDAGKNPGSNTGDPAAPGNNTGAGSGAGTPNGEDKNRDVTIDELPAPTAAGEGVAGEGWDWVNPFVDVAETDWFYAGVRFVNEKELMIGWPTGEFFPDGAMTRSMFVTVLYRWAGTPVVGQDCPFDDVLPDQWYTEAIIWANEKGVACGYGNGFFGTDDNITREQIVVILQNYVRLRGFYPADNPSDSRLHTFVDADLISPWAVAAMEWAVETALLKGKDSATLAPQATATRAEAAVIISRVSNLEIREL